MSAMLSDQLKNLETSGELLLDLGPQPVSNRFQPADRPIEAPHFPMQLRLRPESGLLHLAKPFPLEEVRPRYDWLTCFEPEDHLDEVARRLVSLRGITRESVFAGYSFKDDSVLRRLETLGYRKSWRIDPETDLQLSDPCANVESYQAAFTPAIADAISARRGAADVLMVRHVIEHAYDLPRFVESLTRLVKPGGYIVWELPDCERAIAMGDFTTLWEEHVFYFTSFTFRQLLLELGFTVVHYESIPYPLENSIIAIVQRSDARTQAAASDSAAVEREVSRARAFAQAFGPRRAAVRSKLEALRRTRGPIAMFGAGHLSVAYLSLMGVADLVSFVVDDNPNKKGMRMPVGALPIVGSEALYDRDARVCLLGLNPQNQPNVVAKHQAFVDRGGLFASIFPGSELDVERVR